MGTSYLIGRTLSQTRKQQAELVPLAPVWRMQPWYPVLLEMLTEAPLRVPPKQDLILTNPPDQPTRRDPQLVAWVISGNGTKSVNFWGRLWTSSYRHGGRSLRSPTTHSLGNGLAGAVKGTQIPFQVLQDKKTIPTKCKKTKGSLCQNHSNKV